MPALVAAVTGDDGAIEGVQRTWLDPKRPEKANLARPRKALGRVHGRAVRFGETASGATLLAGEGIETVLSLVTAVPVIHAAAALSAGSLGAFEPPQDLALLVIARDKDVEGGHAANRLQLRCVERGIPSTVIVPEHSDFNDDLIAIGEETLAPGSRPLLQAPSLRQRRKRGVGMGEYYPVMMSHCPTRSRCATPAGSSTPLTLRYGDSAQCHAAARLAPVEYATVAQSLRSLRPHHSRIPPAQAFRPSWLRCRARDPKSHHDGAARLGG